MTGSVGYGIGSPSTADTSAIELPFDYRFGTTAGGQELTVVTGSFGEVTRTLGCLAPD